MKITATLLLTLGILLMSWSPALADHTRTHIYIENVDMEGAPMYKPRVLIVTPSSEYWKDVSAGVNAEYIDNNPPGNTYEYNIDIGNEYAAHWNYLWTCSMAAYVVTVDEHSFTDWGARVEGCAVDGPIECNPKAKDLVDITIKADHDHRNCYLQVTVKRKAKLHR